MFDYVASLMVCVHSMGESLGDIASDAMIKYLDGVRSWVDLIQPPVRRPFMKSYAALER